MDIKEFLKPTITKIGLLIVVLVIGLVLGHIIWGPSKGGTVDGACLRIDPITGEKKVGFPCLGGDIMMISFVPFSMTVPIDTGPEEYTRQLQTDLLVHVPINLVFWYLISCFIVPLLIKTKK